METSKLIGRNENSKFFINGSPYFKKILRGDSTDIKRRQENLKNWQTDMPVDFPTPQLKQENTDLAEYYYDWIEDSNTLQELLQESLTDSFNTDLYGYFTDIASILTRIHQLSTRYSGQVNDIRLFVRPLIALSSREYESASGGQLECFALLQQDVDLIAVLTNYKADATYYCPIHGDIRLDQFLIDKRNKVWMIDFEEYSFGNRLKDIGNVIGSVLFSTYFEIFCHAWDYNKSYEDDVSINHQLREKEAQVFKLISPLIDHFINQYQQIATIELDIKHISVDVGVFLIERVISRARQTFRLSPIDKALLGIGRSFILSEDKLQTILR